MTDAPFTVRDESDERDYFTMLPNIVMEKEAFELKPHDGWLYTHLKRIAGDSGACWYSNCALAKMANMSEGQVRRSKKALEKVGLIRITKLDKDMRIGNRLLRPQSGKAVDVVVIINVWERNMRHYLDMKDQIVSDTNRQEVQIVPGTNQPGDQIVPDAIRHENQIVPDTNQAPRHAIPEAQIVPDTSHSSPGTSHSSPGTNDSYRVAPNKIQEQESNQEPRTRGEAGAANAPPAGTPTEPAGEQLEPNQSAVEPDAAFEAPPPTPPSSAPPPAPPSATSLVKDAWAWALAHREDKAALRDLLERERAGQDRPTLTSSLEALIAAGPDEAVALRSPAQRAQDEMVEALAELTHETKTPEQFEALSSSAQSNLRRAASAFRDQGRTPAQVRAFKRWWYEVRFKGKSDATPPSLRQVKNQWFGAMKWQERTTNSAADAQDYSPKKPKKGVRVDLRHAAPTNVA